MLWDLLPIIVGWPGILLSLGLCLAGILSKRWYLVAAGAFFFILPAIYLSGNPFIQWYGLLLPACLFGAALATWKKKQRIAWLLFLPVMVFVLGLAYLVITQ